MLFLTIKPLFNTVMEVLQNGFGIIKFVFFYFYFLFFLLIYLYVNRLNSSIKVYSTSLQTFSPWTYVLESIVTGTHTWKTRGMA